jgi:thiol-disulfide isomerase/thioredoxin
MAAQKKGNDPTRTLLLIAAVVGVVAVLGVVVALVVGGGDDGDDEPTGEETLGLADCAAATANTVDNSPAEPSSELADFPTDDIFKPVVVQGQALAEFAQAGEGNDTALCEPAPIVAGYDYDGNEVTIDPATDGPTLVVLLAHWCPHCNNEMPVLNEWRDSGEIPDDLNIVGVSTGVSSDAPNYPPDEWFVEKDWQWPVLADDSESSAMDAYGGTGFPTMVFVDADGLVRLRLSGEQSIDDLAPLVDDLVAESAA